MGEVKYSDGYYTLEPLPNLRFKEGRLQQLWETKFFECGCFSKAFREWKYVPKVDFDASDYEDK